MSFPRIYKYSLNRIFALYTRYTKNLQKARDLPQKNNKLIWRTRTLRVRTSSFGTPNMLTNRTWESFLIFQHKEKNTTILRYPSTVESLFHNKIFIPYIWMSGGENVLWPHMFCKLSWFKNFYKSSMYVKRPIAFCSFTMHSHEKSLVQQLNAVTVTNSFFIAGTQLQLFRWFFELGRAVYFFLFKKLKYKGKSYKWFKKKNSVVLRFGHSHLVVMRIPDYFLSKKKKKMKLIFFGTCRWELKSFLTTLIKWKPINVYHARGLRFSRQLVFRKAGKVSAYR